MQLDASDGVEKCYGFLAGSEHYLAIVGRCAGVLTRRGLLEKAHCSVSGRAIVAGWCSAETHIGGIRAYSMLTDLIFVV